MLALAREAVPENAEGATERDLIEKCRGGDSDAFRQIFEIYKDRVYSIALRYSGDASVAQDIAQETFLALFSTIAGFRGDSRFDSWLYRLVVNTCLDEARLRKTRIAESGSARLEFVAAADSQESRYAQAQEAASVRAAVASLPPKFRIAVLLRYFDDLSIHG